LKKELHIKKIKNEKFLVLLGGRFAFAEIPVCKVTFGMHEKQRKN